jgi:formamidopyrimidine-DNA glycosylase
LPELAEIEVIRRTLEPVLVGRSLRATHVGRHDMRARGEGRGSPCGRNGRWMPRADLLDGATVARLDRRGKRLAIVAEDGRALVVQLGMSGSLYMATGRRGPHLHAEWSVDGRDDLLWFEDPRRFGGLTAYGSAQAMLAAWDAELGPDGLSVDGARLSKGLRGIRSVKAALLDQRVVAGVGNIYADESLHLAGISPRTRCRRITGERAESLAKAIRTVLARAIGSGGSTIRDYRSAQDRKGSAQVLHAVYGRGGLPCLECGAPLRSAALAGRTTVWCARCQGR